MLVTTSAKYSTQKMLSITFNHILAQIEDELDEWWMSGFPSWVEVPTEMPTSPMSDMGPDDTVRTPRGLADGISWCNEQGANALGWRELRLRKFTIWCLHDWSCWFEPPRYRLLSPRCSAVGLLSCESVLLAHVVLKLIALIVKGRWWLQSSIVLKLYAFLGIHYICTEILITR